MTWTFFTDSGFIIKTSMYCFMSIIVNMYTCIYTDKHTHILI